MGKLHKDIATFMVQCVEDENQPNEQCITVIILITYCIVKIDLAS